MGYQEVNAGVIDGWCREGWVWGQPIPHETYQAALAGRWQVYLTPTKPVPHAWFGELAGKRVLGLASGGGQQIPIFSALGACCTVLDYSAAQCESERLVAEREGYPVEILQADMTRPLPFGDGSFDLIFHPVSNCYVEEVEPIFRECFRVLKPGGVFLGGYDIGLSYVFDDDEERVTYSLPFNPLKDKKLYRMCLQTEKANDIYIFARIILYIEEHIEDNLKSEDAAAEIGMSRSYFSTRFKEMTGDTFHNYVISRKMHAAACKMEKGTENITQIASDLGYDNYYYFTKVFTKEYGCTPTEYANRVKKCSI